MTRDEVRRLFEWADGRWRARAVPDLPTGLRTRCLGIFAEHKAASGTDATPWRLRNP